MRTLGGQLESTGKAREMIRPDLENEEPEPITLVGILLEHSQFPPPLKFHSAISQLDKILSATYL
jgi:hypothetical protein